MAGNGNGNGGARRWEAYALKILSALIGILSILFWDMRQEQTEVRRVQDKNLGLMAQVESMLKAEVEQIAQVRLLEHEAEDMKERILVLTRRMDQLTGVEWRRP